MKNLIGMTDFVLQDKSMSGLSITNYANFLKQPLELWMFVPCDNDGNVLEEPCFDGENDQYFASAFEQFQQAKERCLFEGWDLEDVKETLSCGNHKTIEDLVKYSPELTLTAQKQIGL